MHQMKKKERKGRGKFKLPSGELSARYITVAECAKKLAVTPATIYYYINTSVLETNVDFGVVLVTRESFKQLCAQMS